MQFKTKIIAWAGFLIVAVGTIASVSYIGINSISNQSMKYSTYQIKLDNKITNSVKKVSDVVAEISAASMEQADGIKQVNRALMQMDGMTQQNASLVEEAAAAIKVMGAQSQEVIRMIDFFKFKEDVEVIESEEFDLVENHKQIPVMPNSIMKLSL